MLRVFSVLAAATVATAKVPFKVYPEADPPKIPTAQKAVKEECSTCPWGDPAHGEYPNPYNAPKSYKPVHRGSYFDVYGHWIETHYSEVFWTAQPAVPLPADIVSKFKGRAISFTGFEVDVVAGGENNNEIEYSVPEFEVYNHHYCATITGSAAKMTYVGSRAQDSLLKDESERARRRAFEVHPPEWEPRDTQQGPVTSTIPTAQNFWMGNGGEHRKSFKHLPLGTGQLIESPEQFILQPMLINTKFPAKPGETPREAFHRATLPKESLSPTGANYSGLMECPCTTRTKKIITGFEAKSKGVCGIKQEVESPGDCFAASSDLIGEISKKYHRNKSTFPGWVLSTSYIERNGGSFQSCAILCELRNKDRGTHPRNGICSIFKRQTSQAPPRS